MKFPAAPLTIACVLVTLAGNVLAKGGGHGGSGHGSGGHSAGHGSGHSSGGHHAAGGRTSSSGRAAPRSESAPHRTSTSSVPQPRHRPGVGQPLTSTAVPRPPLSIVPPAGGSLVLPSFPLFGLSGGFGFSSFAGWPIVGTDANAPLAAYATGGLRLRIDPESAEVIIDGFYAGVAGDFSGRAHPLALAPGSHHVELLAPGYEPLAFDLMIEARHTIRFAATLVRSAP